MATRSIHLSTKNNIFQHAEVLKRNREKRAKYGEFFVEGVRSITGAIQQGWSVQALFYEQDKKLSSWATEMLGRSRAPMHYECSPEIIQALSDKEDTSELLAIVKTPPDSLDRIPISPGMVVVVFDRPGNPGNLGSSIRSCDALGACGAMMTGHATDLYHPHTVRGTMGSLFTLPVVRLPSHKEVAAWIESLRAKLGEVSVIGTSEDGEKNLFERSFTGATILVMGNETFGMTASYRALCSATVKIPMVGSASSLNVSCATTVFLYEVMRQRMSAP